MAINPNVPGDNDFIAQFPAQNRANMQATADAIQDLDALESAVGPLLAKNDKLLALADESDDILVLAENAADIMGSRIVASNLNDLSAPNGYYVRWDNGWQQCFHNVSDLPLWDITPQIEAEQGIEFASINVPWTLPAQMLAYQYSVKADVSFVVWHDVTAEPFVYNGIISTESTTSSPTQTFTRLTIIKPEIAGYEFHRFETATFRWSAVGRWK